MANVLITGSKGQLGSELRELLIAEKTHNYLFTDIAQLDITNKQDVKSFVTSNNVDAIINCAAYTAVDKAEDEPQLCNLINGVAPGILADIAAENNALLIHISSDYVFDGNTPVPHREDSAVSPRSIYGRSKLAGEIAIKSSGCEYIIIRTSWLYSIFGNNFPKTILRLSSERELLNVVYDQIGTPTYATDLAKVIIEILKRNFEPSGNILTGGIYHYSNEGVCSWYDFALAIIRMGKTDCKIVPVASDKFPAKAHRPRFSVLDKEKIKTLMGIEIPHWRDSLEEFFLKINDNE